MIAGLGVLLALVGIIQLALLGQDVYTGMRIYGFWKPRNVLTTPFGPFVNKNHFAGWMLMAMPLVAGYAAGLAERGMRGVRATWRDRVLWLSSRDGGRLQLVGFRAPAHGRVADADALALRPGGASSSRCSFSQSSPPGDRARSVVGVR